MGAGDFSSGWSGDNDSRSITYNDRPPASRPFWARSGVCRATFEVMAAGNLDARGKPARTWPDRSGGLILLLNIPPELSQGAGVGGESLSM